ncbi:MAG: CDP-diacylglycerol--serine O-phosphatidyltransferase [Deltaproteobacteria bacterium]|nr:CDP-diacylglycerol--serine O-phosphatidyltransferase [Deltaproteobacteria bacterium]
MKIKRKKNKRPRDIDRKGIYILPNLFTSASLFSGFYAIIGSIQMEFKAAAIAIIVSAVFDCLDGRIARFTKTTSHFGTEYDSLSDLVAFGVAPAVLAFMWALSPFGRLGWLAACLYVICGALRLARFNVEKTSGDSAYFKGLPIPAAAICISSMVLFAGDVGIFSQIKDKLIIFMIYFLSFLMVSSLHYFSFKEFNIRNQKPFNVFVAIILICIVIAYKPSVLLFLFFIPYVFSGPIISIYHFHKKQFKAKGTADAVLQGACDEAKMQDSTDQENVR